MCLLTKSTTLYCISGHLVMCAEHFSASCLSLKTKPMRKCEECTDARPLMQEVIQPSFIDRLVCSLQTNLYEVHEGNTGYVVFKWEIQRLTGGTKDALPRQPHPPLSTAGFDKYLNTTWTDFPPTQIFASWWDHFGLNATSIHRYLLMTPSP